MKTGLLRFLKAALTLGAIVLILGGMGATLSGSLPGQNAVPIQLHMPLLLVAVGLCVLYRVLNSAGWGLCLAALGGPVDLRQTSKIWLTSETLRWLPAGSVMGFCGRLGMARQCGIAPAAGSLSVTLELVLTLLAWGTAAAGGLLFAGLALPAGAVQLPVLSLGMWLFLGGLAGAVVCLVALAVSLRLHGRLRLPAKVEAKLATLWAESREIITRRPRLDLILLTLALYIGLCVLNGVAFWCILHALGVVSVSLAAAIGINAAGWILGFLAIGAPGGLGVREGSMTGMLAVFCAASVALPATLLWRAVQVVVEILCLALYYVPDGFRLVRARLRQASA